MTPSLSGRRELANIPQPAANPMLTYYCDFGHPVQPKRGVLPHPDVSNTFSFRNPS